MVARKQDAAERAIWQSAVARLDPADLIFLDEMQTPTTMTPIYARAPRGAWAVPSVPRGRWHSVTFLDTLTLAGMGPAALYNDGPLDHPVFDAFVDQFLVPTLRSGQVAVLDNLSVHKSTHAKADIAAARCQPLPLPRYSPDFNPIEQA